MSNTAPALGGPSPELPVTISPQEFGVIVDLAANATAQVGRVLQLGDLFARCVRLANQAAAIGALPPRLIDPETLPAPAEPSYADKHRLNNPVGVS